MKPARAFAELDAFLADYRPRSPYGQAAKDRAPFFTEAAPLEREYGLIERCLALLASEPAAVERVEARLGRLPALDFDLEGPLGLSELFLLKRFLGHVRGLFAELPEDLRAAAGADWRSEDLHRLLGRGGPSQEGEDESFRLSASHLPELGEVRADLEKIEDELRALRLARQQALRERFGLDFSDREFLLISAAGAARLCGEPHLLIEPFDGDRVTVKPGLGAEGLRLAAQREQLIARERSLEAQVLGALSTAAGEEAGRVRGYQQAAERLDTWLAKARLAGAHRLTRPRLRAAGEPMALTGARHVPLEARNRALGLDYTPLTCIFEARVGVLHGSNMGGKTAALKTVALLQLLAQSGFFVPAQSFAAPLFDTIDYVGEDAREPVAGLSSFGLELHAVLGLLRDMARPRLILMDEFAKTTNSREGAALLSALLGAFLRQPACRALVATHLAGLDLPDGAAAYRMRGFDEAAFRDFLGSETALPWAERLARIHRFMRYELVADDGTPRAGDALKVARILGLEPRVVDEAERLLERTR
jgi:hypothetical protein